MPRSGRRPPRESSMPFTLVTVGALDQPYKGTSVLLDAVAHLQRRSVTVRLRIVGGGRLMPALRERARTLGLESKVEFLGQLDSTGVRRALDAADVFVMPSLTEGLPRALLEAMAKGSTCRCVRRRRHSRTAAARVPGAPRPAGTAG